LFSKRISELVEMVMMRYREVGEIREGVRLAASGGSREMRARKNKPPLTLAQRLIFPRPHLTRVGPAAQADQSNAFPAIAQPLPDLPDLPVRLIINASFVASAAQCVVHVT